MDLTTDQMKDACEKLFGDHPEDVIEPINSAEDALGQLMEIFHTIINEASGNIECLRIKRLAEVGAYLAFDFANYTGSRYETMLERLVEQGIVSKRGKV